MEFVAILAILGFFLLLMVGAIMGLTSHSRISKLEKQITLLRREIADLGSGTVKSDKPKTPAAQKPDKPKQVKPKPAMAAAAAVPATLTTSTAAETPPAKPNTKPPKKKTPPPRKPRNFELELGAKWTVWVGGLALLLGAVFLLRYSIEAGFFTPAMRVGMAAILGLLLLGAGEWIRRGDKLPKNKAGEKIKAFENSYIPGILTAVGIFTLLGTVYAAQALYGFIGVTPAFLLMGLISVGALALGLIHGPYLSAIGLVAAFATPLLIQSNTPSFNGLYLYLFVITVASLVLARLRDWSWLAIGAFLGGIFWLLFTLEHARSAPNFYTWFAYFAVLLAANFYLAKDRQFLEKKPGLTAIGHNGLSATAISALLAFSLFMLANASTQGTHMNMAIPAAGLTAMLSLAPLYKRYLAAGFWVAGLFAYAVLTATSYGSYPLTLILGGILALGGLVFCNRYQDLKAGDFIEDKSLFGATLLPPFILATGLEFGLENRELWVGLTVLALGGLFAAAVVYFKKQSRRRSVILAFLSGSALSYALAVFIGLDKPWLNAALALGMVIFALFDKFADIRPARWFALAFGVLSLGVTLLFSIGDFGAIDERIIFNEIWIYFALPAAIALWAGWDMRRRNADTPSEGLLALAVVSTVLFFVYQIRHYIYDGFVHTADLTFDELGLYVATGLAFTLGRKFLKIPAFNKDASPGLNIIPAIFSALTWVTLGIFLLLICFAAAPLLNGNVVVNGGTILNSLTLAYLLPCVLMGVIIWKLRDKPSDLQTNAMRLLALFGMMFYVTSQIRVFYSGKSISIFEKIPEGWETYTITASWLLIGVIALAIGIRFKRKAFRIGSAVIIFLTVLKAFLIDMATLEGVLRAISFVILGVVLIIIGRVYQKLLFEQNSAAETP